MRYLFASIALLGLVVGCTQGTSDPTPETMSVATVNDHCPIMGGEVTPKGGTVEWNGKTIGFCCDGCDEKWEALSEEEKAEKLAAADYADGEVHDHGDHDHS